MAEEVPPPGQLQPMSAASFKRFKGLRFKVAGLHRNVEAAGQRDDDVGKPGAGKSVASERSYIVFFCF